MRPATCWIYDLHGLDLAVWAARAPAELAATAAPGDTVLMVLGTRDAAGAALADALASARLRVRWTTVEQLAALEVSLPAPLLATR